MFPSWFRLLWLDVVRLWCSFGSDVCGLTFAGLALVQLWLIWFRLAQLWVSLGSACSGVMLRDAVLVQLWFSCGLDSCNFLLMWLSFGAALVMLVLAASLGQALSVRSNGFT